MCKELEIGRASYYKWLNRKPTLRDIENEELLEKIKEIDEKFNHLFGHRKMTFYINKKYERNYNKKRIYRLMCINDIQSVVKKPKKNTYIKSKAEHVEENKLNRDFNASTINEKWLTDITEIAYPGIAQKAYLSTILDLYDRYPVAKEVSSRNDTLLVNMTLDNAIQDNPEAQPLFHSDRGFQYTREVFQTLLTDLGITQSMSRVSRCIDNGPMEGFQGIFKDLLYILHPDVETYDELLIAIDETFEFYINEYPQERYHGLTSGEVRKAALQANTPIQYPIKPNPKIINYWNHINELQNRQSF